MAVSLTSYLAGADEVRQPCFIEAPRLYQTPTKLSSLGLSHCKCFWKSKTMSLKNSTRKLIFSTSLSAHGKEAEENSFLHNASEDTDEMFDKLLDRYGKAVLEETAKSLIVPRWMMTLKVHLGVVAVALVKFASEETKVLLVKPLVYWTRFFIVATAFSRPQIDAIGSKISDMAEQNYGKVPTGDTKPNSWTLLDFDDVIVHIFLPEQRAFYNLEEFYRNATPIELPFENQALPYRD